MMVMMMVMMVINIIIIIIIIIIIFVQAMLLSMAFKTVSFMMVQVEGAFASVEYIHTNIDNNGNNR